MAWTFGAKEQIICVEKNIDDGMFILNKVYDVIDGKLIGDNGTIFENLHFLRDLNDKFRDETSYEVFGTPIDWLYRFTFYPVTK